MHTGRVYIYVNKSREYFEDPNHRPIGFNPKTDVMILDMTSAENPKLYAYQAHKVSKKARAAIIDCMQLYDQDFKTRFDRSNASLKTEYIEHYRYRLFQDAQNIEFDNEDENTSAFGYFKRAVSKVWDKIVAFF